MDKLADFGWGGDGLPAEEPQAASDRNDRLDADQHEGWNSPESYNFVYANGQFHISDEHFHDQLAEHANVGPDHTGPMAVGRVTVDMGKATFEVHGNVSAQGIARVLKDYCKNVGWRWGGLVDLDGEPIGTGSEFAPVKSFFMAWEGGELRIARKQRLGAVLHVDNAHDLAYLHGPLPPDAWEALHDFATDEGLKLYGANDNVLKRHEDLEVNNNYSPEWNDAEDHFLFDDPPDERKPGGVFKCPACSRIFPSWGLYILHRRQEEGQGDETQDTSKFPELNMDATFPPHFDEMRTEPGIHTGAPKQLDPKDQIAAPVPFLFDIIEDKIVVGRPGARHSDIPGKFTPGGIVEGSYEPGGRVQIRSMTNMPYSVRHMLELWYYQHPHMEIRSVHLQDDEGKRTKLAKEPQDIGGYITAIAAADPAVWTAYKTLQAEGGEVYVVGGAVRDALLGKEPKDVDLMVTGMTPEQVRHALARLPGRVDLTGKDFGVFRYKQGGGEVEIALPRRERSTGITNGTRNEGLDVQADHTMTPEEDLFRRDFTANAMAVNLTNGQLIDPFDGSSDVQHRKLRTLNTKSLSDDPLRTIRALVALSRHGLYPDEDTKAQIQENGHLIKRLPGERIQAELDKLFKGDHPGEAIRLAQDTGLLEHFLPEVSRTVGHSQNNPHHELELFDHLVNVLDRAKERKPDDGDFALAALLHDIGKKDSHWTECRDCGYEQHGHVKPCPNCGSDNTSGHFYQKTRDDGTTIGGDHEVVGANMARSVMNRFPGYEKERIDRVTGLIRHHMFPAFTTEKGARKFMALTGNHADDLLHLRWADQGGKSEYPTDPSLSVDNHFDLLNRVRSQGMATNKSMLAINGRDLIAAGIPPGPQMGQIINYLTEQVIENPELNTREALLGLAQAWKPATP